MNTVDIDLVSIGGCVGKDYSMTFYMMQDRPRDLASWERKRIPSLDLWIETCKKCLDELLKYPDKLNKIMLLCGDVDRISSWPVLFVTVTIKGLNDHIDVADREFDNWIY